MKAAELAKMLRMEPHEENGLYCERHHDSQSGSMYYYLAPGDRSLFHSLEYDEYWSFNAGTGLHIWIISPEGELEVKECGIRDGAEPLVFIPRGSIFAARHENPEADDGTLVTCITVPEFRYSGCILFSREKILEDHPELLPFYE